MAENWRSFADDTEKQNKSVTIIMPKALKNFLDFQMQLEYLFGGNTVA